VAHQGNIMCSRLRRISAGSLVQGCWLRSKI